MGMLHFGVCQASQLLANCLFARKLFNLAQFWGFSLGLQNVGFRGD